MIKNLSLKKIKQKFIFSTIKNKEQNSSDALPVISSAEHGDYYYDDNTNKVTYISK